MARPTEKGSNVYEFKRLKRRGGPNNRVRRSTNGPVRKSPKKPFNGPVKRLRLTNAAIILIGLICAAIVLSVFWLLTYKNAQQVMVSEQVIGAVKGLKLTAEELQGLAVEKLKTEVGANVSVHETVSIKPVHAKKSELVEYNYMISEIKKAFTYSVEASIIVIDGIETATVKNASEMEQLLEKVKETYIQTEQNIVSASIEDKYVIKTKLVSVDEIMSKDKAYNVLTAQKETKEEYTVASGDSLWGIASRYGTSVEKLIELNDGMTADTVLKLGQTLNLIVPKPVLSVKTVEETTANVLKKKTVEYIENPNMPTTYKNQVRVGKDGQATVTSQIIRINGLVRSKEDVREDVIIAPENDIIEIGTKK